MNTYQRLLSALALSMALAALLAITFARPARAESAASAADGSADLPVEFTDCVESIGVTLVPTASVRVYVPHQFILAGEGQPVTPLVVRTSQCSNIAVAGHPPMAGEIVQIGAVIVPPDFTGDINNYTIWYSTSNAKLATQLRKVGVDAQLVPVIDYDYQSANNSLSVRTPVPFEPSLTLSGSVLPSPNAAGSFLANWWQQTKTGIVKMSTNVPVIKIGTANLTLTTKDTDPLAQLLGGSSTGFPIIQQFNTFAAANMQVNVNH
jgi:hypothetical protein